MRVNLASLLKNPSEQRSLFRHWAQLLSEEYHVDNFDANKWLYNPQAHEFVVEYLKSQGWDLTWYETPLLDLKSFSHGFVVNDECGELMKWRLTASCE